MKLLKAVKLVGHSICVYHDLLFILYHQKYHFVFKNRYILFYFIWATLLPHFTIFYRQNSNTYRYRYRHTVLIKLFWLRASPHYWSLGKFTRRNGNYTSIIINNQVFILQNSVILTIHKLEQRLFAIGTCEAYVAFDTNILICSYIKIALFQKVGWRLVWIAKRVTWFRKCYGNHYVWVCC